VSGDRLEYAVAAFLRNEFGASVTAIIGFVDILIEDAQRQHLGGFIADLERMRLAAAQLSALIDEAVGGGSAEDALDRSHLRHELRTPLNAIKGYGELLVEEIGQGEQVPMLDDLGKVLNLADHLLGEIDRLGEAAVPVDVIGNVLRTITPLGDATVARSNAAANRILVVDDNAANRDLLSRRLQRDGYQVTSATDGATTLALVAEEGFDLVLLDLMMPG
jgi:signal transduction histidine kinase